MSCQLCGQRFHRQISLNFIFSFQTCKENFICEKCQQRFVKIDKKKSCSGCGRLQEENKYCGDCLKWQQLYPILSLNHQAIFFYNDAGREFMKQYKFQGDLKLASIFSETLKDYLKPYSKTHILTTIPTSQTSFQNRGFHAVDLLLDYAGINYQTLLTVKKETGLQSSKKRAERLLSDQPFGIKSELHRGELKQGILIIDDVYTTGRTLLHARERLEEYAPTQSFSLFR